MKKAIKKLKQMKQLRKSAKGGGFINEIALSQTRREGVKRMSEM